LLREGAACQPNHFHSADDSPRILAVDSLEGCRIFLFQLSQELVERSLLECVTQLQVSGRRVAQSFEKGFEVEPRSPAEDRNTSSIFNELHGGLRETDELRGVERLTYLRDIDQVMRNTSAIFRRRLGRSNIHATIDLHGIDRDDFAPKLLGQEQSHFGFAYRCRPGEKIMSQFSRGLLLDSWQLP
jgi:hypothetical protein